MTDVAEHRVVTGWDVVDGGILGAVIVCPFCADSAVYCTDATEPNGCSGSGQMHQPYRLPNGAMIDVHGDAEIYDQIEPSDDTPAEG